MLQRLYIHNFGCLENFELKLPDTPSALLIGKNGTGKSTIARALQVLQGIGRGVNRLDQLVKPADCTMGRTEIPVRVELEVLLGQKRYVYILALELPERFREYRILEERLEIDGSSIYTRQGAHVTLLRDRVNNAGANFSIDWHLVALPVIQDSSIADPLSQFKEWLARMVILAPIPQLMRGESSMESLEPSWNAANFADWLTGLLAQYPASYGVIDNYLKEVMHDLQDFRNVASGKDSKTLTVRFEADTARFELGFDALSDGEKCIFLCAVVLAANKAYGPLLTFWDEPDNFLSLNEVGHFIAALRRGFQRKGQILVTSHNEETIRSFSSDNTYHLSRRSHMEPTVIRKLVEFERPKDSDVVRDLLSDGFEA